MRTFEEVLAAVPLSRNVDLGGGRVKLHQFSQDDRVAIARETLARERDIEIDRDRGGSIHAAALAEHLATLVEFHSGDDPAQQHADPILSAFHPAELSCLRIKTKSGRQFMVSVIELPA